MSSRNKSNRRIMTSAIDNMSVAEVRKFLGECRKKHSVQTPDRPMYITDVLSNGMQLQDFALKFQQGHHQKRHNKSRKHGPHFHNTHHGGGEGGTSSSDDDDYYDEYNTSDSDNNEDDHLSASASPSSPHNPTPQKSTTSKPSVLQVSPPPPPPPLLQTSLPFKQTLQPQPKTNAPISSDSISNTLAAAMAKKRGRPKKEKTPSPSPPPPTHPDQFRGGATSASRTEHHSRSLMEFVKKPTKRTKN